MQSPINLKPLDERTELDHANQRIRGYEADMRGMERMLQEARDDLGRNEQYIAMTGSVDALIRELDNLVHFGVIRKKYARDIARTVAVCALAPRKIDWI